MKERRKEEWVRIAATGWTAEMSITVVGLEKIPRAEEAEEKKKGEDCVVVKAGSNVEVELLASAGE